MKNLFVIPQKTQSIIATIENDQIVNLGQIDIKSPEEKQELLLGENGAMYECIQEIEDWKNKITFSNPIVDFCIVNDNAFILNRNELYCYDLAIYPGKNITKIETKLTDMKELIKTRDNRIVLLSAEGYELIPLI
jgi:hypothetical protein